MTVYDPQRNQKNMGNVAFEHRCVFKHFNRYTWLCKYDVHLVTQQQLFISKMICDSVYS